MTRFSEARTREVVDAAVDTPVGRVDRFVVDPDAGRIGSLRLDNVTGMERYVSWTDLTSFGEDTVTIPDAAVMRLGDGPREEGIRREYRVLGKRVLTDGGHELGQVQDVEFDPADGRITGLLLEDGSIAGERLRGIGSYAVVVRS